MTTKEYLSQYIELGREVNALCVELGRLRDLMRQTGGSVDGMPHAKKYKAEAQFEGVVDKYVDLEHKLAEKMEQLLDTQKQIHDLIETVEDPTLRTILRYRYINGWTWERIALEMHYSYMHVCRLHGLALQKVKM